MLFRLCNAALTACASSSSVEPCRCLQHILHLLLMFCTACALSSLWRCVLCRSQRWKPLGAQSSVADSRAMTGLSSLGSDILLTPTRVSTHRHHQTEVSERCTDPASSMLANSALTALQNAVKASLSRTWTRSHHPFHYCRSQPFLRFFSHTRSTDSASIFHSWRRMWRSSVYTQISSCCK
jgi:hypothetical protein